jgi:PTS system N-acetylglucosamine-specific IIC component
MKALGARGFVRPSPTALQVVIGANAEQIAGEIREALNAGVTGAEAGAWSALSNNSSTANVAVVATNPVATSNTAAPDAAAIERLLAALGGRTNVRVVEAASSRLRISVVKSSVIDATAIRSLGLRGVTVPSTDCVHVIVGPAASVTSESLSRLIA